MNDFTKEELITMKYWCRENHDLSEKLQSMIDNYPQQKLCPFCGCIYSVDGGNYCGVWDIGCSNEDCICNQIFYSREAAQKALNNQGSSKND